MKICFIAPGDIPIPVDGWGALETVVWNQFINLTELGHDCIIINEECKNTLIEKVQSFDPDIIHLHYGLHYELMPMFKCRKIITNHDGSFLASVKFHESIVRGYLYDCEFFILTTWERDFLLNIGISPRKIKIVPNGVDFSKFNFKNEPAFPNHSICLGKIDHRKNQSFIQSLNCNVNFAGQNTISEFNSLDPLYLGSWNRDQVYQNLTDYTNLVLISQLELQPLVCLEALSAGLGLVISEVASQNLDVSLPFITTVPQDLIYRSEIISAAISNNRDVCLHIGREKIREYARSFDWKNVIALYAQNINI